MHFRAIRAFLFEPCPELIARHSVSASERSCVFRICRTLVTLRFFGLLSGSDRHKVRVDHSQNVEDVREDRVRLRLRGPDRDLRIKLPRKCGVRRRAADKRAERTPRQRAPDIRELVARLSQQVVLYRLAVLFDELREAEDSPIREVIRALEL